MTTSPIRLGAEGLRPVSARLIPASYLASIPWYVIALLIAAGGVVLGVWLDQWWIYPLGALPALLTVPSVLFTPRRVRARGYLDREEDLVSAQGIMFRKVTATPYGRVQSVSVSEGPVERRYGIATLTWSTASTSGGSIPGLPREEAERLRVLLTDRGIERMQAL